MAAILSSEASFDTSEENNKDNINYLTCKIIGDATESGLLKFFQYIEDIETTRNNYRLAQTKENIPARMPFNAEDKFALTIVQQQTSDSEYCIYIKGAPEKIWKFCKYISIEERKIEIN